MNPSAPAPVATVDAQNPWLGLVSFTEETRGYFHGREEEAAELGRRVQRKLLTVLFGQSGLGKTSILQAGLVPRLRPEGFCPVYVRLDYDPYSPPPAEQIKRALFAATASAGTWTQTGSAVEGETLWEFLHHRDDVLKDADGRTLTPILIFDQFEEIFTLAQSDDAGRKRAHDFLADLADLVENRPPAALEARIDRDEADAGRFDFARADYRILISLREDYLAHLEGLKVQMPSVTQNRMRLARMNGAQAVAAVRAPAPHLVSEAVAEAVVRFVAGGTDLARAEVEPSLLSLICRELNNTRLAQGHAEISADLLAGSRDTILSEFYERALADQPPGVRIFIEDEMLTDSGFRESVAEERVRKGFAAAGAAPDAVATLVNRRLLRVEDRLDMRRVEITHDVLCSVIAASRGVRHEREALEESRRQLAAQEQREKATQRSLVRARLVAGISAALMLLAAASAVFGWINLQRARKAEAQTQAAREVTEKARREAEKLVGFLLEDFYEELRPTGQVEIVAKLADQAVAYYDALPPELVTNQTQIYRGMALVRKASALNDVDEADKGYKTGRDALEIFTKLRAGGDNTEGVTLGLALSRMTMGTAGFLHRNGDDLEAAARLLRPLVASGHGSRSAKLALGDTLNHLSHEVPSLEGIKDSEESRKVLADMGALDLTDLTAASIYGDVTDTESRLCLQVGQTDKAQQLATIVADIAAKVLDRRPGDLRAMKDRFLAPNVLGEVADDHEDYAASEKFQRQSADAAIEYTRFNPSDFDGWLAASSSFNSIAEDLYNQGRIGEALSEWKASAALETDPRNRNGSGGLWYYAWVRIGETEAGLGQTDEAQKALDESMRVIRKMGTQQGGDEGFAKLAQLWHDMDGYFIDQAKGDYAAIYRKSVRVADELRKVTPNNATTRNVKTSGERTNLHFMAESAYHLGNLEAAESAARNLVNHAPLGRADAHDRAIATANAQALLGKTLVAMGRKPEATADLAEAVDFFRSRQAAGATSTDFHHDYAEALLGLATAQPDDNAGRAKRRELLAEAASQVGSLSTEAQQLAPNRDLIGRLADAPKL